MLFARPFCFFRTALGAGMLLWLLSLGAGLQARPRPYYSIAGHEQPVALLHAGPTTYLVTEHSVFRLEGPHFVRKYQGSGRIQCAVAADTSLWLGTRQGVVQLHTQAFRPRPLMLPIPETAPNITALFRDARGALWVGANGYGVFRLANGSFVQELNTPAINAGLATADSSVWIATSIGLNRKQGPTWSRYNEEGVANHEIPDNIVEKLLPDNAGNLWVIMSDAICVFESGGQQAAQAELPAVRFLGQPGNEVFAVAHVRGEGQLFATAMGLLLLPATVPTPSPINLPPATDRVAQQHLLVPLSALPGMGNPRLLQIDKQQRIWLVSADAVTVLTTKEFRRFASARNPAM